MYYLFKKNMRKYLAEGFGTLVLVLVWVWSAVIAGDQVWFLWISIAFWLAVLTMVYTIWPISGCHINPAITFAMWIRGKINSIDAIFYVIAQLIGAILGAMLVKYIAIDSATLWANAVNPWYSIFQALATEIVFTTLFLLVIFWVTAKKALWDFAWIAIGLALTMIHIVTIPVTNTSVNPARSFGPALLNWDFFNLWIFIIWPLLWSLLAVWIWKVIWNNK